MSGDEEDEEVFEAEVDEPGGAARPPQEPRRSRIWPWIRACVVLLAMAGVAYVAFELGRGTRLNSEGVRLDVDEDEVAPAPPDEGLPALMRDLAAAQACDRIRGRYLAIPADESPDPHLAAGRLWVERCAVVENAGRLRARVAGRGFRYLSRSAEGPLGSSFAARGYLRFEAEIALDADLTFRYERERRRAIAQVVPAGQPLASLRAIGALPVQAEGGWSSMLGSLGLILGGGSVHDRARQVVEEQGSALLAAQARRGATLSFDLCESQLDVVLGPERASAPRPFPEDGQPWLANGRGLVYPGGIDLLGPFQAQRLDVELELEDGAGGSVALVCPPEAERIAAAFLANAADRRIRGALHEASLRRGQRVRFAEDLTQCPKSGALLILPAAGVQAQAPLRYRVRVREPGAQTSALVRCPSQGTDQ